MTTATMALTELAEKGADIDLPGFFGPIVSVKMALRQRGAHEEESIHG